MDPFRRQAGVLAQETPKRGDVARADRLDRRYCYRIMAVYGLPSRVRPSVP